MTITDTTAADPSAGPVFNQIPLRSKGEFPAWFNADTLPEGIEHRIRAAQLRLWLLLPEFLDATTQAWNVVAEWEALDLPDDQRAISRRLGFDTLNDMLFENLPELVSADPQERFRAQCRSRATAEEARGHAGDPNPDWLQALRSTSGSEPAGEATRACCGVPSWINLDALVDADLRLDARAVSAQINDEADRLRPLASRANALHSQISAAVAQVDGPGTEALDAVSGANDLFDALRGIANIFDPEGPR